MVASVTKSFTGARVGIAIDRGCPAGVDEPMTAHFQELADQVQDRRKNSITIGQLLQFRAGCPRQEGMAWLYGDHSGAGWSLGEGQHQLRRRPSRAVMHQQGRPGWRRLGGQPLLGVLLACVLAVLAGCGSAPPVEYVFQPPEQTEDGLPVGTLGEVGIDADLLGRAVDEIRAGRWGEVHSLLLYTDGRLVFEEYFPGHDYQWDAPDFHGAWTGWDRDTPHNVHSVGKSLTSACVGIAIDEGFITSADEPIGTYLPGYRRLLIGGKQQITIEDLLTMTSGLAWDEWGTSYDSGENDAIALWLDCDDPIACVLDKPLVHEPGRTFTYSGGNMVLLGQILKNASGMDIEEFSARYLFEPLGIDPPQWARYDNGVVDTNDQRLTPRAMVTIGATYLDHGNWNGQQIIPSEWVAASAHADTTWTNHLLRPIPPDDNTWGRRGYAYGWWTHEFRKSGRTVPAFYAWGWGGQEIAVFPDHNAVAVFTGGRYAETSAPAKILGAHVIPALLSARTRD